MSDSSQPSAPTVRFPDADTLRWRLMEAAAGRLEVRVPTAPEYTHNARLYGFGDDRIHGEWTERLVDAVAGAEMTPEDAILAVSDAMAENMRTAPWSTLGEISRDTAREYAFTRNDLLATLCATVADPIENAQLIGEAVAASDNLIARAQDQAIANQDWDGLGNIY